MNLSPRTINGLIATQREGMHTPSHAERHIETVTYYVCPVCDEKHDYRSEAAECCGEDDEHSEEASSCPVCGNRYGEPHVAADCCLWKDLDAPSRWRIADAVEAGATWAEALKLPDPFTGVPS